MIKISDIEERVLRLIKNYSPSDDITLDSYLDEIKITTRIQMILTPILNSDYGIELSNKNWVKIRDIVKSIENALIEEGYIPFKDEKEI